MSATDDLLANSTRSSADYPGGLPAAPARQVAVVCCMDARIDLYRVLGLQPGEAHVLRNAGGVITDDVLRSLAISQRRLGTREIMLIHHTGCGLLDFDDQALREEIRAESGSEVSWSSHALHDLDADLRREIEELRASPALQHVDSIRGFVFDVGTGRLHEVEGAGAAA